MRILAKCEGIQELKDAIDKELQDKMKSAASDAIRWQKETNLTQDKSYLNHTWNLRNAPGDSVIINNKEVFRNIPTDGSHPEAEKETNKILDKQPKEGTGIIIADGMFYASFVESKGYDVLGTAAIMAEKRLKEEFE